MKEIIIYTTSTCPYCRRAKQIFKENDLPFTEIQTEFGSEEMDELIKKTGHTTVPQIFIGDKFLGGCDDLISAVEENELNALLAD